MQPGFPTPQEIIIDPVVDAFWAHPGAFIGLAAFAAFAYFLRVAGDRYDKAAKPPTEPPSPRVPLVIALCAFVVALAAIL